MQSKWGGGCMINKQSTFSVLYALQNNKVQRSSISNTFMYNIQQAFFLHALIFLHFMTIEYHNVIAGAKDQMLP